MASLKEWIFGNKSVIKIDYLEEQTREGLQKAYIPKFLFKPPFGYPRYVDMDYIRWLAKTPYVEMCINTILDEICAIEWDIVPADDLPEEQVDEVEIQHIKNLFLNPNTNSEEFDEVFIRKPVRDILEVNSGILVKVYNLKEELVEVVAREGSTFTKNPDIHGMYTYREDIILPTEIVERPELVENPFKQIWEGSARDKAAYFQYGWLAGPMPIPFGKKEIIWLERMYRTDDHYGYSPVQTLAKTLQWLIWSIESDVDYFNDNNVPKGIIGLDNSDADEISAFKKQWYEQQRKKDEFGNWRKQFHKVPIVNKVPSFTRIELTSDEMQLIEKQKWYSKLVWSMFGVTPTELGYTEDAQGQSNQIVQSKVFKKKAINPMLRLLENKYNKQIINEFGYTGTIKTSKGKTIDIPKYQFKFMAFDIDDERNKYELYKLQTESGLKTINEVRLEEGYDELDWGNEPPKNWNTSPNSFNFGDNSFNNKPKQDRDKDAQDTDQRTKEPNVENPDKSEKESREKIKSGEKKMLSTDNPLILRENERPKTPQRLKQAIDYVLKLNEQEIIKFLEAEYSGEDKLKEVKDINSVIAKIKSLFNFDSIRILVDAIIKNVYYEGWDKAESMMQQNFIPDVNAINFLQTYTFDNIKGMSDEIADDLRQELQRGFMEGEGVNKMADRIKKVFNVGRNRADMIARTEINRSLNTGKLHAYIVGGEIGIKKEYSAHIDHRTSALCKRLNGKIVGINEKFTDNISGWSGMCPPAHPNCRSTFIVLDDDSV
jgi:SPP1 gp7 family putative phage head morphogenesis protein